MTSRAIAALMHEHEIILKAVSGLQRMSTALRRRQEVEIAALRDGVEFMRTFADRCHHAKEEDLLFPALVAAGLPANMGPIAAMKAEHAEARACVAKLAAAVDAYGSRDASGALRIVAAVDCIESLYPQHIAKENNVLFPMAERQLTPDELTLLGNQFDAAEHALGEGTHHHWAAVAERLGASVVAGITAPAA